MTENFKTHTDYSRTLLELNQYLKIGKSIVNASNMRGDKLGGTNKNEKLKSQSILFVVTLVLRTNNYTLPTSTLELRA